MFFKKHSDDDLDLEVRLLGLLRPEIRILKEDILLIKKALNEVREKTNIHKHRITYTPGYGQVEGRSYSISEVVELILNYFDLNIVEKPRRIELKPRDKLDMR